MTQSKTLSRPAGASEPAQTAGNAPEPMTPIDVPLHERAKEELLTILGHYRENLQWYVEERNKLVEQVEAFKREQKARIQFAASSQEAATPKCPGGDLCDGDLPGEWHEKSCPCYRDEVDGVMMRDWEARKPAMQAEFDEWKSASRVAEPAPSPATKETPPINDELIAEIARELYDRFLMGGWEPQDAYPQIRTWLSYSSATPAKCEKCNAKSAKEACHMCIGGGGNCPIVDAGWVKDWPTQVEFEDAQTASSQGPAREETPQWVIVSDGEGAQACVIIDGDLHEAVHKFMCCCGKSWHDCEADMRWDIEQLDSPDNWSNDEAGKPFSMTWPHETGKIRLYKLSKPFDAGAKSVVAAPQLEVFDIPFCNSPCGHSSQYAHTSDGGKTIICLICEVERLTAGAAALPSEWISPHKSLPDEDDVVLVAVVCESDDHDGGTQRWEEVHEATMYRAGGNIVAACYADNAEYMDDDILGWRELPSPPVPSKEPK